MTDWIRNKIIEILIDGDSRDIEIFGGLQVAISGLLMSVSGITNFPILMIISFILGSVQVIAALTMSLSFRHYTNLVLSLVCVWLVIAKYSSSPINYFAVIEYGYIALTAGYCSFKTKIDIERIKP